jgi:aspartokinase
MNVPGDVVDLRTDVVKITVNSVVNRPGTKSALFADLGRFGPLFDPVIEPIQNGTKLDVTVAFPAEQSEMPVSYIESHMAEYGATSVTVDNDSALLLVRRDRTIPESRLVGRIREALSGEGIPLATTIPAGIALIFLVPSAQADAAASAVRTALGARQ